MAVDLVDFATRITGADGREYVPRACGGVADDGLWEGWVEFAPVLGGPSIRTGRETEQPNRADLFYWAQGLTTVYLEGALDRASRAAQGAISARTRARRVAASAVPVRSPVLDPFAVFAEGEQTLRAQLNALSRDHLETIIQAYRLTSSDLVTAYADLPNAEVVERIVMAVRKRVSS